MGLKRLASEYVRSLAAALATVFAASAGPDVSFAVVYTNVTTSAGINHLQHPGNNIEVGLFRTGGAAVADFDNDGWVDLFATRLNARPLLYRNLGNGTFQDVAVTAGFTSSLPANGPAWGDIDNDGDKDLYVTSSGGTRFYLYVNNGNGTFSEQAVARGAAIAGVTRYGQSATFGDYDGDGYLDIHTNDWATETALSTSRLLRNVGAVNPGYFEDVTSAAGLDVFRPSHTQGGSTDSNAYRYSSTFSDLDRDGHPDLAIAADFLTSQIFWNNGDGTFTDGTAAAGVGTDEDGMGSAIGDYDGDGRLDWFVSALVDLPGGFPPHSGNRLFHNNGNRTFTDQTDAAGVRNSGWSWGTTFFDHDNDSDLDLFVTNGWDTTSSDQSHLYRNDNGVFTDISNAAGVTDTGMGRGLLNFDYDKDGDLDVFVVNHGARPILYRNDGGNENDWLRISVEGTTSNRDGLGAFITVDPDTGVVGDEMVREINAGSNFLSHNELTAHFGLGPNAGNVDAITVVWPSGAVQELANVSPNQVLTLIENAELLPGDYNSDGSVDAADYVVWRKTDGGNLAGYALWRANFANSLSGAGGRLASASVPESSTAVFLSLGVLVVGTASRMGRANAIFRLGNLSTSVKPLLRRVVNMLQISQKTVEKNETIALLSRRRIHGPLHIGWPRNSRRTRI
jgi:enediyne biosynthesis protein E4